MTNTKRKYEKPAVIDLTTAHTGSGACGTGSGDSTCQSGKLTATCNVGYRTNDCTTNGAHATGNCQPGIVAVTCNVGNTGGAP